MPGRQPNVNLTAQILKKKTTNGFFILPSELFAGDDGVVVGERLAFDDGFDFGQQAADAASLARFGCQVVLEAGPASGAPGAWTFRYHGVVLTVNKRPGGKFYKQ